MCLDRFCGICGGIPKTTKALTAEPRYMTFEAQTFLLNKDTWLCTLTFGTCGDMAPRGLKPRIADTTIVLWGKNARIHAFLVPINRSTYFFLCRGVGMFLDRSWPIRGGAADIYMPLRLHYTRLFPDPRFLLFVLQNISGYKNAVECLLQ